MVIVDAALFEFGAKNSNHQILIIFAEFHVDNAIIICTDFYGHIRHMYKTTAYFLLSIFIQLP